MKSTDKMPTKHHKSHCTVEHKEATKKSMVDQCTPPHSPTTSNPHQKCSRKSPITVYHSLIFDKVLSRRQSPLHRMKLDAR